MALRNAFTRAAGLRTAVACTTSMRGLIGESALPSVSVGASLLVQQHGFTASAARAQRNLVENEIYDRSRQEIVLGNRVPSVAGDAWVAPNATLIGDTDVADQCTVWHGSVLKGDLGAVRLGAFSNVQEKCVIDAAGASTRIGQFTTIGACSSISSAIVEDNVLVGARSVLSPGSYVETPPCVETNAALEAGSVVEPGQLIPGGQLWGGNPARYVRDLDGNEIQEITTIAKNVYGVSLDHADQHTPWGIAYVQTEALRKALSKD